MTRFVLTLLLILLLAGCMPAPSSHWEIFQPRKDSRPSPDEEYLHEETDEAKEAPAVKDADEASSAVSLGGEEAPKTTSGEARGLGKAVIPLCDHERIDAYVHRFTVTGGSVSFQRRLERSGRFVPLMRGIFVEEGLPEDLVYLAMVESGFQEHALSHAQASGPWQFIESTGRLYGLENDAWRDERRDPVKSTRAAAAHLKDLHRQFGDWYLALAAYNAGPGRIQQAIRSTGSSDFWTLSQGDLLHSETRDYVPKFLACLKIVQEPEEHGFHGLDYHSPLAFDAAMVDAATDLAVIASLCNTSLEEIRALNPELKRWCTPPGVGRYRVRIPAGTAKRFASRYAALSKEQKGRFQRHKVAKGETLIGIARRYRLTTGEIMELNRLSNPRLLRAGATLILPLPESKKPSFQAPSPARVHVVRQGDTVYQIARAHGLGEKDLKAWNGLDARGLIRPGQELVLSKNPPSKGRQKPGQNSVKGRRVVYQVRSGDTFWGVSRRFNVATRDILEWNGLSDKHVLQPGQKLTLHLTGGEKG